MIGMARSFAFGSIAVALSILTSLGAGSPPEIVVSVADQEMALIAWGKVVKRFPISTSKFGTGDAVGSYQTPLGTTFVSAKIGDGLGAEPATAASGCGRKT